MKVRKEEAILFTRTWNKGYYSELNNKGEIIEGISRRLYPNWQGWKLVDAMKAVVDTPEALRHALETSEIKEKIAEFYDELWSKNYCNYMRGGLAVVFYDTAFITNQAVWLLQKARNITPGIRPISENNTWGNIEKAVYYSRHIHYFADILLYLRGKYQAQLQDTYPFYRNWEARIFALGLYIRSGYNEKYIK